MYTKVYHKLKDLNLFAKLIGLILIILSIFFVDRPLLVFCLIGLSVVLSVLVKNYESLQLSIILIVISMFYYLHSFLLLVVKLLLLYIFSQIIKSMTNNNEKRYIVDKVLYKDKSITTTRFYLNSCFKNKKFSQNMLAYDSIDRLTRRKYSNYIVKQAEIKTEYDLQDIYYRHKLSFYKLGNKKTTILDMKWSMWDNIFLIGTVILFVLVLFL